MYEELVNRIKEEILTSNYNESILPFQLDNLNSSESFDTSKKKKIIAVDELYKKRKTPKHIEASSLLGLISFLRISRISTGYSLESLAFLGFYLSDYSQDELDTFITINPSSKTINLLCKRIDNPYERSSYLDYYQNKDYELLQDLETKSKQEIREKIGFIENASFGKEMCYEIRRIWL